MRNFISSFLIMVLTASLNIRADLGGIYDLPTHESPNIYRTPFNPLPNEGAKQLIYRLGTTYNEIESKLDEIPEIFEDYLEIEKVQSYCPIILYASDFGTTGTIIDQPGYYILCGDVAFEPTGATSAITTATNHVTIDLNNHAIYQANAVNDVNGITINQNIHDVIIKNGTLSTFSQYSITGSGDNQNITIENMLIENTGDWGIVFNPGSSYGCRGLTIANCLVNGSSYDALIFILCFDVTVRECSFIQANLVGAFAATCSKCRFIDCHFDNNEVGATVEDSQEILFDNCTFNKNAGNGLNLGLSTGIIVQNCQAIGNTSDTGDVAGFCMTDGSGIIFKNCVANLNESITTNYGVGFWLELSTGCRIEQCIAENNKGIDGAHGIYILNSSQDNLIINCKTNYNNATTTTSGYGIKVELDSGGTTIQDCETFSNSGYGIYNDSLTSIIKGCISGNNGTASFGGTNGVHYARRNKLGNHFEIGEQENISVETTGINEVGCVTYLDAAAIGTTGITINQPGHYILCEDITLNSGTAIMINSNYVTFDINGKKISGLGLATGISVESGKHDIAIKNGNISDFSQYGIFVANNCHHIDIESIDMSKSNTCASAIRFNGTSGNKIHDCAIKDCRVIEITTWDDGTIMTLNYCTDVQVINSHFNNNTFTLTGLPPVAYSGINLFNSHKCQFINCQFNDNNSTDINSFSLLVLINSDSILIDECTFNNNSSNKILNCIKLGETVYSANGCIVSNSIFNNNRASLQFFGIYVWRGTGNTIESCIINNNNSATSSMLAIFLDHTGNVVSNCCINANTAENTSYGIAVSADYNAIFGCETTNNTGNNWAYGIHITTTTQTIVQDCVSFGNTTAGIYNDGTNSIIIGCDAANNGSDYAGTPGALAVSFCKTGSTIPQPTYRYDNAEFTL